MDLVKPFLALVFGVLLFLYYLNNLKDSGTQLAMGIIGIVVGSYYIASGVLSVILGSKMPAGLKTVFDILNVALFPGFMFVVFLFLVINTNNMGPTGWVIYISCMAASISLCAVYVISRFAKGDIFMRLVSLFGLIFVLALVCELIFTNEGGSEYLGGIEIVPALAYAFYAVLLFNSLKKEKAE